MTVNFGMFETGDGHSRPQQDNFDHKAPAYTDCTFQARYFPRVAEMQAIEGGYIYAVVDGYYDLVVKYNYEDSGALVVHTAKGELHPKPSDEFLYSLERKQGTRA